MTDRRPWGALQDDLLRELIEWEAAMVQRAARYLILRGRLEVVEHDGAQWVRILPEPTA